MITSKQRAYLRSLANTVPALYQIGKDGISKNTIELINNALEARELIKVHVLENSMLGTREACGELCKAVKAEPVQCIGNKFVIYKQSVNNPTIEL